jgi:hypothetical protein
MRKQIATLPMKLGLILTAIFIAACASSPPTPDVDYKHDYDFSRIKTFSYLSNSGETSGNSARAFLSDMAINRINDAISDTMELKGYRFVEDAFQADVLVTWHLIAQDKTDVRTTNTGPSYGGSYGRHRGYNRSAFYNCWNCGSTQVTVKNYTQGTFIVDIVDPTLNQSVWRAVIQSKLKAEVNQDQQAYNVAAGRIFASFPPY